MNPTTTPTAHRRRGIDWRAVAQLGLGVGAGIVAGFGTIAVAVTSFSLSFDAISAVARAAHIRASLAWMMPVSVDGAMLVATVAAVVMHRMGKTRKVWYPWLVVIAGTAISIACNAAHATGKTGPGGEILLDLGADTRKAISAIPAVMLALSVHLFVELVGAFIPSPSAAGEGAPSAGAPAAPSAGASARPSAGAEAHSGGAPSASSRLVSGGSAPSSAGALDPHSGAAPGALSAPPEGRTGAGAGTASAPALSAPSAAPNRYPSAPAGAGASAPSSAAPDAPKSAPKSAPESAPAAKKPTRAKSRSGGSGRTRAKSTKPAKTVTDKADVRFLHGQQLVDRIRRDFARHPEEPEVTQRALMRVYAPMGTPTAKKVMDDYTAALAKAPGSPAAAPNAPAPKSSEPPAPAAEGGGAQ